MLVPLIRYRCDKCGRVYPTSEPCKCDLIDGPEFNREHCEVYAEMLLDKGKGYTQQEIKRLLSQMCHEKVRRDLICMGMGPDAQEELNTVNRLIKLFEIEFDIAVKVKEHLK